MTQEDKELLLKDLCARLPYGVKCNFYDDERKTSQLGKLQSISITRFKGWNVDTIDVVGKSDNGTRLVWSVDGVRPYLRPMSSMTEKELMELDKIFYDFFKSDDSTKGSSHCLLFDFYNQHHLDYRGFIEKGLALEATKGMYNVK